MIYTLGKKSIYEPLFLGRITPRKARGGSVWETRFKAEGWRLCMTDAKDFAVYGVMADWDTDTCTLPGEEWNFLKKAADLVRLEK